MTREGWPGAGLAVLLCGIEVEKATTDENGRAIFENVRPDTYNLQVRDPDFVWSSTKIEVRDADSRRIVLHEPPGWTARATLLDSTGRPVPLARVKVESGPVEYVRVERGVQDLAFYTDRNGEIELPRMHHGSVRLEFSYGSREANVRLDENEPSATAQLPAPK